MKPNSPAFLTEAALGADAPQLVVGRRLAIRLPRTAALALAYLVVAVPALLVAFVQPVWQLTDEAQHTDVLAQYAHGVYPIEGRTTLRPETVAVMQATGNYRWSPPETVPRPAVVTPDQFAPAPPYLSPAGYRLWVSRHIWWFSYEAMQPPLFYAVATPVWAAADLLGGPFWGVYAVRVLNSLTLGLLGPLVLLAVGLLAPARRLAGPVAVALTASLPGLLLNGSQVTNDTFGAVLGGATLLMAARLGARGWRPRTAALLGLLFGLTVLAKLTAAGLAAGLLVAWWWPMFRLGAPLGRQVRLGAIATAAAALIMLPWLALNGVVYGHPVPSQEAARLIGAGTGGTVYSLRDSLQYFWVTFWTGEHRWTLPWSGYFAGAMVGLVGLCGLGVVRALRGHRSLLVPVPRAPLAVLSAAVVAQVAWAMSIPTLGGLGGMSPGRYAYPVVVAVIAVLALGLVSVRRGDHLAVGATALVVAFSAVNFTGYYNGLTGIRHVDRQGPPSGVATRSAYAEGTYGLVTVDVDRLVIDGRLDSAWAHVHVRNDSPLAADWSPMPDVRIDGGRWNRADYASSTPFPESLAPGAEYWGWARLALRPQRLRQAGDLELRFGGVSVNHYREVGSIDLVLPVVGQASEDTHGH